MGPGRTRHSSFYCNVHPFLIKLKPRNQQMERSGQKIIFSFSKAFLQDWKAMSRTLVESLRPKQKTVIPILYSVGTGVHRKIKLLLNKSLMKAKNGLILLEN